MTDVPLVSVIIVSRGRPDALIRCLTGVSQLFVVEFEVVLVADPAGVEAARNSGFLDRIKVVEFDEANISTARNNGIGAAAGEIIAFIDDDAVPEPTWLTHLVAPFKDQQVSAAGGNVRGRNGISFQWTAQTVDQTGEVQPLHVDAVEPTILAPKDGLAIRTEGTNCAFRRSVLANSGGFDPLFRFYLDETDVNMRLALQGHKTAIVPLAQVHHSYAASAIRTKDRVPRSLFEIGASTAVFLRKYCAHDQRQHAWTRFHDQQRKRMLRHMVAGRVEPADIARIMASLVAGYAEGRARKDVPLSSIPDPEQGFKPFRKAHEVASSTLLAGRIWQRRKLRLEAREKVKKGFVVTLFLFSPTAIFHRMRFDPSGYWEQKGGLFGKSDRDASLISYSRFATRVAAERDRIAAVRGLQENHEPQG